MRVLKFGRFLSFIVRGRLVCRLPYVREYEVSKYHRIS